MLILMELWRRVNFHQSDRREEWFPKLTFKASESLQVDMASDKDCSGTQTHFEGKQACPQAQISLRLAKVDKPFFATIIGR